LPLSRHLPGDILAGLSTAQDDVLETLDAAHQALVASDVRVAAGTIGSPNPALPL
jgi:hypothetical protein